MIVETADKLAAKEHGLENVTGFSVGAVANYFIRKSIDEGHEVTHMKLQKLSYIAHGWCLALLDRPLIRDTVQAWEYGPVFPGLYHELREYGKDPVDNEIVNSVKIDSGRLSFISASIFDESSSEEYRNQIMSLLDRVWDVYHGFSAVQLSAMTHRSNTPWNKMVTENPEAKYKSVPIPDELIKEHYRELAEQ